MTLIAGLVCKDAIIFASDSEESGGIRKSTVEKISHTKPDAVKELAGPRCKIVIAGAGNGTLADYATQRILAEVEEIRQPVRTE